MESPLLDISLDAWKVILDALTLAGVIVGGSWALFLYASGRRGQVRIGIQWAIRLARDTGPNEGVLFVRLVIANTSGVLFRYDEGAVTLMDARRRDASGSVLLVPFAQRDPLPAVTALMSKDPAEIAAGNLFQSKGEDISLEPGERVETEVAFPVRTDKLGLMAIRVLVQGRQGRTGHAPYWWGAFFYADPQWISGDERTSLATAAKGAGS